MGLFSLPGPRSRRQRHPKLPIYEKITPTTKKRDSDPDEWSDCESDEYPPSATSTSTSSSRQDASSTSSAAGLMLPRKPAIAANRPVRMRGIQFYRLPNKIVRWLCFGMITTLIVFILTLVRASVNENRRISSGSVQKKPDGPPLWESFEFLTRYYGGVRSLVPFDDNIPQFPRAEDELPWNGTADYEARKAKLSPEDHHVNQGPIPLSKAFNQCNGSVLAAEKAEVQECFLDADGKIAIPQLHYFEGRPSGFPDNVLGSYEAFSLPEDICFERYGKFGPYGYGYTSRNGGLSIGEQGEREGADAIWADTKQVDWRNVNWADVQRRCYQANQGRYKKSSNVKPAHGFYVDEQTISATEKQTRDESATTTSSQTNESEKDETKDGKADESSNKDERMPRTAIVLRTWDEYMWKEEDIMNVRSLISELALASGARYDIHLLMQVKNDRKYPVWADEETYRQRIKDAVPAEFGGLVTIWTETQMLSVYQGIHDNWIKGPDLPVHGSYRGLQMAMQYFAHEHPEYDYYWQWEMDIRYTGHYYDLVSKLEGWAKEQPRKGLWERNSRFYVPSVHGTWEDFRQMARVQSEMGTIGADNIWDGIPGAGRKSPQAGGEQKQQNPKSKSGRADPVWGPLRPEAESDWFETASDPQPPTSYERDSYQWGVGEEADLITLNPIFDPVGTTWALTDDITGYNTSTPSGSGSLPPRRAHIITASRMSRRLLLTMHRETALRKHHAFPEMWAATSALHHGLKAVFAPHPQFVDREWPVEYLARTLNGGKDGSSGGARTSVYGAREHNLRGLTWFYGSGFAPNLYRRWLGLKVNNDGGEQFESQADLAKGDGSVSDMRGGEGRMCLPPMLIHPVKEVELPVEAAGKAGQEAGEGGTGGDSKGGGEGGAEEEMDPAS